MTVMYSTGPLFISVIWKQWIASSHNVNEGRVRVLQEVDFNQSPERYFNTFGGSSWHAGDVRFLMWVGQNWVQFALVGAVIVIIVGVVGRLVWAKMSGRQGPSIYSLRGLRWPHWHYSSRNSKGYELVDRHEL